jgi:hypothetical protein
MLKQRAIVLRMDFLRREAGQMDHAPEAVGSSDEMVAGRSSGQGWIDPAEDHVKAFGEDIR